MRVTWGCFTNYWYLATPDILISLAWARTWTSGFESPTPTPRWCYIAEWPGGNKKGSQETCRWYDGNPSTKGTGLNLGAGSHCTGSRGHYLSKKTGVLGLVTVLAGNDGHRMPGSQAWGFLMMVRDATTSVRQLVLGTLRHIPSIWPPSWCLIPASPVLHHCFLLSIFLIPPPPELIHPSLPYSSPFPTFIFTSMPAPGPLAPVSPPCSLSLFHQHLCLSLSLSEFSCYFSLYYTLILRVPPYQTGVVYPTAICKTSLLLQVTPSGPGQEKEEAEKAERLGRRMRLKILRLAALDTSIQISELPRCPVSIRTLSPKTLHSSVFGHHTWLGSET